MMRYNRKIFFSGVAILFLGLLFASCKKVSYDYIDGKTPDERSKEFMDNFRSTLLSAPDGWVGYMYIPANGKGFTFYMKFAEKNRVTMYSDFADVAMVEPKESSYQLRNTGMPSLIFDTYNYIHLPADPKGSISGGPSGTGQSSDFEYSILKFSADTILLRGNLKSCELIMVKVGKEQATALQSGKLKENVDGFVNLFASSQNSYVALADSRKLGISFTHSTRQISYQILESDGSVSSYSGTFYYDVDGVRIADGFGYGGLKFVRAFIRSGSMYLLDASGNEHEIKQSVTPLTPLISSFGSGKTYKVMHIEGENLPAGVNSGWNDIFSAMVTRFHNSSGRVILYMDFAIQNATKARVIIRYQATSGSQYTADAEYDYVIDGDVISLSNYVPSISNGNWNSRVNDIGAEVINYFKDRSFKINWVEGSGQEAIGGLYPLNDPSNFYYGVLK
ncbi:MAG TPA: DUF4302 domain-containing protein [Ginsengibacter sp.]|nr:DUF4302 domain-containing protein [Ginsengibacter sp.]HRP17073.1 DUF4302 domain-containing protein [Ginsengibacter sp.]HRP43344.1 DUF4302 domain-containing protein [Ginsengibacter sp.]